MNMSMVSAVKQKLSAVFNSRSKQAFKEGLKGASIGLNLGGVVVLASAVMGSVVAAPIVLAAYTSVGAIAAAGVAYQAFNKKATKPVAKQKPRIGFDPERIGAGTPGMGG